MGVDLICSVCQFPRHKHSHHSQFQATSMKPPMGSWEGKHKISPASPALLLAYSSIPLKLLIIILRQVKARCQVKKQQRFWMQISICMIVMSLYECFYQVKKTRKFWPSVLLEELPEDCEICRLCYRSHCPELGSTVRSKISGVGSSLVFPGSWLDSPLMAALVNQGIDVASASVDLRHHQRSFLYYQCFKDKGLVFSVLRVFGCHSEERLNKIT